MSATGLDVFDTTLQKSHAWLNDLMELLDWQDKQRAYRALRGTLHALRDRLTVDETAQFGAQLPMLIRGFYYEGWDPPSTPRKEHRTEFLARVEQAMGGDPLVDPEQVARAVFTVIGTRVTEGEIDDVRQVLPGDIRELWA